MENYELSERGYGGCYHNGIRIFLDSHSNSITSTIFTKYYVCIFETKSKTKILGLCYRNYIQCEFYKALTPLYVLGA